MDHYSRFIGPVVVILWTVFRLVRYWRAGVTRRPQPGVPGPGGAGLATPPLASPAATTATASPIESAAGGSGFPGGLVAVLVWLAGNAAVWGCLFLLPQLAGVAVIPRLVVGVLATFYFLYLARAAAAWVRRQSGESPRAGGDPIS
jgi:hypothetical protein